MTSGPGNNDVSGGGNDHTEIQIVQEQLTFEELHELQLKDLEKKIEANMKRKKRNWDKEIQRMQQEFLTLYPSDRTWGSEDMLTDPMVINRKGSTDVVDVRKMRTAHLDYPDSGRHFKLGFNCVGFDQQSVRVSTDGDQITIQAIKTEEGEKDEAVQREYVRKIEKPKDVDINKLKSFLTCDGILVVESGLSVHSPPLAHKPSPSPIHAPMVFRPPSPYSQPIPVQKPGVPIYVDAENGMRYMSVFIEMGQCFKAEDVTVQFYNDIRIQVKARNEERTTERFCKNKFVKDFELSEKIEAFTIRGGLSTEGKLLVGAVVKGKNNGMAAAEAGEWIKEVLGINSKKVLQCNTLDPASCPPANVMTASATSLASS